MANDGRPLSPHLQVYRPQITSVLSIAHRLTGILLALGFALLVLWLLAAAGSVEFYGTAVALIGSWPGRVLLMGVSFALYYHLCNGVRHLFWDAGFGFELRTAHASGWTVLIVAAALSLLSWAVGLSLAGGGA